MSFIAELGSSILLFFLVFGMSATVDIRKLFKQLRNRNALLTGVSLQFIILPFLGFLVVWILDLDAPLGITLLVVTSSPGGSYSNWWCSIFNADLALSVTMTTISTLLSVVMLPVNLVLYATTSYSNEVVKSLDWTALFLSLVVVIGGISSGLICSATIKSRKFNRLANKLGNIAGIALVTFSIVVSSTDHNADLWSQPPVFYFAVGLPCLIGLIVATWMVSYFRLDKPERVAVSVECCYQNTGIATSVAITMFSGDELATAIGVPLFYGICEASFLAVYCIWAWKKGWTKAPRDENICVVIATSYEIQEQEMQDPEAIEVVLGVSENGELPNDLIFASTSEGYKIDEESLHSLTSSNSGSNGPKTPSRKLSVDDFPLEDVPETSSSSPADDHGAGEPLEDVDFAVSNNGPARRRNGNKKYSTIEMQSPSDQTRSLSPVAPPIRAPELNNGERAATGRRLGNAVKSLVSSSRGSKGAYTPTSSTSFDEEDREVGSYPQHQRTSHHSPPPAVGKTID